METRPILSISKQSGTIDLSSFSRSLHQTTFLISILIVILIILLMQQRHNRPQFCKKILLQLMAGRIFLKNET